jgi:hypothetical protein
MKRAILIFSLILISSIVYARNFGDFAVNENIDANSVGAASGSAGSIAGVSLAQSYALQSVLSGQTGGSPWVVQSVHNAALASGAVLGVSLAVVPAPNATLNSELAVGAIAGVSMGFNPGAAQMLAAGSSPFTSQTIHNASLAAGAVASVSTWAALPTAAAFTAATNAGAITGSSFWSGVTDFIGVTRTVDWCLQNTNSALGHPAELSGVTSLPIFRVNHVLYPRGINVVYMDAENTAGATAYQVKYEVYSGGAKSGTSQQIARLESTTGASQWNTGVTVVAPGKLIYVWVGPTTKSYSILGQLAFQAR